MNRSFWSGKTVVVVGHTGFKGGWMCLWLQALGARVVGIGLSPDTVPSFFEVCGLGKRMESVIADVRELPRVVDVIGACDPDVVFHMAAQALVRRSYRDPVETFATNVMGTVHVLEAARRAPRTRAVVVVTSDKCYQNRGSVWGYREDEPMGGRDPYSASKGCAELVSAAYQHSYFRDGNATVATARAGNVIGGGDWAEDRIVPDAVRALARGEQLGVRNPGAVRPWQLVLEPLAGYLRLAERVYSEQRRWEGGWNFGPYDADAVPVSSLSDLIVRAWGDGASWRNAGEPGAPHEEAYLKLDSSKARQLLGWRPRLSVAEAVAWTIAWYRRALTAPPGSDEMHALSREQIETYESRPEHAGR